MLFRRSEMEHSEDEHQLNLADSLMQSKSPSLDVNNLLVGSEVWFVEVVGLQNWRIDPRKAVNHVYNKDLHLVFKDKESHKGYSWERCKSDKVKRRLQHLYVPLFQVSAMPKDRYVCEILMHCCLKGSILHEHKLG